MKPLLKVASNSIYDKLTVLGISEGDKFMAIARPTTTIPGISGFLFHIPKGEKVSLQSEITDHYLENNISIQDHIALRPEQITLEGQVAELCIIRTSQRRKVSNEQAYKMKTLLTAPVEYASLQYGSATISAPSGSAYDMYFDTNRIEPGMAQFNAFNYFYNLWLGRMLFSVETPWGVFDSMGIVSIDASQDADSTEITNFSVTFKKVRFGKTVVEKGQVLSRAITTQAQPQDRQVQQLARSNTASGNPVNTENLGDLPPENWAKGNP